ncbi:MAG: extracellular solute-binding protein, partial [Lachnospiraceae bacterium]|nr:extracellular solute-binding protein [Lachnospiraceae bacterium]
QAASGDKVTLNLCWWGNQTRNDVTKKAVDLYMSQNPNVEIKVEFTDWSGYWDKLSAMAAGGNLPDIIQQDYSYINQYQKSGQLADLTPFIEDGTIDVSKIPESVIESGSIDGKCYALSLGSNAPMMAYDKAVVEEAGVTLPEQMTVDELYEIGKTIYEKTGVKTYYDGGVNMMQIVARANGSHLFDELAAGEETALKNHFTNVDKFAKAEFSISPDLLAEKNPDVVETKPIIDGTTWNDFSYSNQFISISSTAGRELGITMYPTMTGASANPMFLKPSQFFSIAETSPNKEEAAKFLNWFTNSVECNEILMAERGIPVNSEVADAIKPKVEPTAQTVFEYISKVAEVATPIDAPDPAGKGEVEALGKTKVEDLRYGDVTAEDAAASFAAESKKILDEAAK